MKRLLLPLLAAHAFLIIVKGKQSHALKFSQANLAKAMSHAFEVQLNEYFRLFLDETSGKYEIANKGKV